MSKSDHEYFNCSEQHEHDYVARLYKIEDRPKVRDFLKESCKNKLINNSTHGEVYQLIEDKLGLKRQ